MLEKLRAEMEKKNNVHAELVKKYEEKIEEKKKMEAEMLTLEKEIIHNQGAMQAINDIAVQIMEEQEKDPMLDPALAMQTSDVEVINQ